MNPHTGHRAVIQTALEDWWITTDPLQPFTPDTVTTQIDTYLTHHGYTISPDIPRKPMPTRTSITLSAFFTLICLTGAILLALDSDWGWALIALIGAGTFTHDLHADITERRHRRNARPATPDRTTSRQR